MRLLRRISDAVYAFRFGHTPRDQARVWSRLWRISTRRGLQRGAPDPGYWSGEAPPDIFAYAIHDLTGEPSSYLCAEVDLEIWFVRQKRARIQRREVARQALLEGKVDLGEAWALLEGEQHGELGANVHERRAVHGLGKQPRRGTWHGHIESFLRSVFGDSIVAGAAPGSEASQGSGAGLILAVVSRSGSRLTGLLMNRRNRGGHRVIGGGLER
jgi:hypothetical protein